MFANPENQDLCFGNTAQDMGAEIKAQQPHKGISSPELVLRWFQTRSDPRHTEENTNPTHNIEHHKLTIKDDCHIQHVKWKTDEKEHTLHEHILMWSLKNLHK